MFIRIIDIHIAVILQKKNNFNHKSILSLEKGELSSITIETYTIVNSPVDSSHAILL